MPHVEACEYEPGGYVVVGLGSEERDGFQLTGKLLTKAEADRIVATINGAGEAERERAPMCDVEGCAEDAETVVDGRLRCNPQGQAKDLWIAVEFRLCAEHEAEHDKFHGGVTEE